jgi:hypothetical protein
VTTSPAPLTIAARFAGPPSSGNGGYTSGRLAAYLATSEPVAVTLRRPPPLDTALVVRLAAGEAQLLAGSDLVAVAGPGTLRHQPPSSVGVEQAVAAESSYAGRRDHPFPTCFVCGTDRAVGDGLRLSPGRYLPGHSACVWTPDPSLAADDDASVAAPEFVWAALDCPGGWSSDLESRPLVLGRMTAAYDRLPSIGQAYVVVGEMLGSERRKTFSAAALYDPDGHLLARAEHIWIAIDPARF